MAKKKTPEKSEEVDVSNMTREEQIAHKSKMLQLTTQAD
jgi:hypothetical protein